MIKHKIHGISTVVLLAFIMLLPILAPIKAFAVTGTATYLVDGHTYTYSYDTEAKTATITAFTRGSSTVAIIPAYIGDYKVTSIIDGQMAIPGGVGPFSSKGLTSVAIPEGITYIGKYAFYGNSLSSITIPRSVTDIKDGAFAGNPLTRVVILNSTTNIINSNVGGSSFPETNSNLTIYGYALNTYNNPSTAKIYADAKSHTFRALSNQPGVIYHNYGNNDAAIVDYTGNSQAVQLPVNFSTVYATLVNPRAFLGKGLNSVTFPAKTDGYNYRSIDELAFADNELTSITIPDTITNIGVGAFANNNLNSVTILNSQATIGADAFINNQVLPANLIIRGYDPSTAKTYASANGYTFENIAPTVTSVSVDPPAVSVEKGATRQFSAVVNGTNNPAQTVTWAVYGGTGATSISTDGLLTIAADETAASLTVTATSTVDSGKSGTATVTVTSPAPPNPTVTSVSVDPPAVSVEKGATRQFSAVVNGINNPAQTVTWAVYGGTGATGISTDGLLTIAADETAASLTVTATSTVDTGKSGMATVTVTSPAPPTPTVTSVSVDPPAVSIAKGTTRQFSAVVNGTNNPAQTVTWAVHGGTGTTGISIDGLLTIAADETAASLTVTATSTVDTGKSGTAAVTVTSSAPPTPTVTSVSVDPPAVSVEKGATRQFSAVVNGTNNPAQTVTWAVYGGTGATSISTDGLLTIAADETAASLTVTATSTVDTGKSGAATVTVTNQPPEKVAVTSITVSAAGGVDGIVKGGTLQMSAVVLPANATDPSVIWSVENGTGRAEINASGLLTAISPGTVTVKATAHDGSGTIGIKAINITNSSTGGSDRGSGNSNRTNHIINTEHSTTVNISAAELNRSGDLTVQGNGVNLILNQELLTELNITSSLTVTLNPINPDELSPTARAIVGNRPVFNISIIADGAAVTNLGQLRIEIPYTLQAGDDSNNLAAFYIADDGTITLMEGSHYDNELRAIVFTTNHLSYYAVGLKTDPDANEEADDKNQAVKKFNDVVSGSWAESAIYYLAERDIVTGKSKNTFAPDDNITRAEFVTILAKMSKNEFPQSKGEFADVPANEWYAPYVAWALEKGIARGYGTNFKPNDYISRQDMALMLVNYAEKVGSYTLPTSNNVIVFADDTDISGYARQAVYAMKQVGIISGRGNNTFAPAANASRAEAAQMTVLLLQEMEK